MNKNAGLALEVLSLRFARPLAIAGVCVTLAGCAFEQPPRQVALPVPAPVTPGPAPAPALPAQPTIPVAPPEPPRMAEQAPPALPDKTALLRSWVEQQDRLYRVAAPLLISNTELCPRHARNLLGFTAKNRYSYTDAFADTAQAALGLEERLRVTNVLPGSSAEAAGLQKGDLLFAVEIEPLPQGPDAERASASIIGSELQGRNSISLTVLRHGERRVHDIGLTPACAMVIDLGNADFAGSFADGQRVMVTRGMLDFVQSDKELAYVLAQEIAHNILAQKPRPDMAAVIDRLHTLRPQAEDGAAAGGIPPYLPDMALRARKLALYLLARAGYGIDHAAGFWQRLANPPASDTALAELAHTLGAITARKQLGGPLVPEQP